MQQQDMIEVLNRMDEGVYFVDRERRITYWNPAAERITGYAAEEVTGRACFDGILRHVNEAGRVLCTTGCPLAAVMRDGTARQANVYLHHKRGHRVPVVVKGQAIHDAEGNITGSLEIFHSRQASGYANPEDRERAGDDRIDLVTGVADRRLGETTLRASLAAVDAGFATLGLLFIDVDHFKVVNDTYGHRVGDAVLRMVAQSIANGLRSGDVPARWGGEEFVALLPGVTADGLQVIAERLRMLVENSWLQHEGARITTTISVGATLARPFEGGEALVHRADRLMYASKQAGRNRVTSDLQPGMVELPLVELVGNESA